MKRCPKHPDRDQVGDRCEVWTDATHMCPEALVPVPREELDAMRAAALERSLAETTLPAWVVAGIRQLAWDQGHACGQAEVDNYVLGWIGDFEAQRARGRDRRRRRGPGTSD